VITRDVKPKTMPYLISTNLQKIPSPLRERVRVRGNCLIVFAPLPPHPAFGHLLPQVEGLILNLRANQDALKALILVILR